jgi:gas vesicle protein
MNTSDIDTWVMIGGVVSTIGGSFVAWLVADARSKTRWSYTEEKVSQIKKEHDHVIDVLQERASSLEIKTARAEQERAEFNRNLERLDATKASKEVVDAFRNEVSSLRADMDKRFDRIERMLETKKNPIAP